MSGTVVLTLGRLPKALDLARSFAGAGWRVVVAEPFARTLVGASRMVAARHRLPAPAHDHAGYIAALARIAEAEGARLILPVSEETVHVAHLAGPVPVFTMPAATVLRMHSKLGFIEAAQAIGLAVPESHPSGSAAARALAARSDVVIKPLHSCSGRGLRVLRAGDAPPEEPGFVVQRRIAGQVISSCTLAHGGRIASTSLYRGALFSGSVAIAFERIEHAATEEWIERFVAATGWTGFISFDFILDERGRPWGIECNPRTTSGLHFWRTEDIAPAILEPGQPLRHRPERLMQQAYAVLTEAWSALLHRKGTLRRSLSMLARARDVSWSRSDPMPFLTMTWTSWPIIREALRRGMTLGEVATLDVGWQAGVAAAAPAVDAAALSA
ncbi:MAG: ATP-grasp domain-containing protein [Rhodovarius sp.]|nr:ATP-grasp domain-containing protein [Rhodovarius sp.]MDW8313455.1 ATP-grasp domain-containing protein [Rhodovarius sp.]